MLELKASPEKLLNYSLLNNIIKKYSTFVILCDNNTAKYCLPYFEKKINQQVKYVCKIKAGEENKNFETYQNILVYLLKNNISKNTLLINLGGGVVCDIGGFVAATYKRGIDYINVPTTLMAMVDAAWGAKTAVNIHQFKNQIGTFYKNKGVIIDNIFLDTLPKRHKFQAYAEVLKVGLISSNKDWKYITQKINIEFVSNPELRRMVLLKQHFYIQDWNDHNIRQALNFGHTIGHALESLSMANKKTLMHGEAIYIGMLIELLIAQILNVINKSTSQKIINTILPFCYLPFAIDKNSLLKYLYHDKKNIDQNIKMTLIKNIGNPILSVSVSKDVINKAILNFNNQYYASIKKIPLYK